MRIQAIIKRILLQRKGDKRSLALLFVAPLLILSLMYLLLQVPSNVNYRVGIDNQTTETTKHLPADAQLVTQLKKNDKLTIVKVENSKRQTLNDKNLDAVITVQDHKIDVTYTNTDTGKTQVISSVLNGLVQLTQGKRTQAQIQKTVENAVEQAQTATQKATQELIDVAVKAGANPQVLQNTLKKQDSSAGNSSFELPKVQAMSIESHYLYGTSKLNPFDNLAPVLVSFFVFFFVFLISGISLVNERTSGTLTRMLVSPVKRSEIVAGYTVAYGFLAVVQTLLVLVWAKYVLQMKVVGHFGWVILINLLIAMIALMIGLLLSAVSKTEFQFIQFVPIAIVPQFLFSGIINVDTMSQPLQWLAHLMPLYYAVDALVKVVKQGMGFSQISFDLGILFAIVLLLYMLNVVALKALRRT
ncbi:ABC transporter permease [Lactococcus allomyrinae]|uniref:ABC transporter permease n=1 Tax=Lactococcus allomyrinae TaxID=2419773 RepID=A0A387BJZ7_9LACT|nr:ABC transporter permease [Lactococcus allomyrinae]AYG01367.1 ABC transporter permease [Lactococcus allomyrinae]